MLISNAGLLVGTCAISVTIASPLFAGKRKPNVPCWPSDSAAVRSLVTCYHRLRLTTAVQHWRSPPQGYPLQNPQTQREVDVTLNKLRRGKSQINSISDITSNTHTRGKHGFTERSSTTLITIAIPLFGFREFLSDFWSILTQQHSSLPALVVLKFEKHWQDSPFVAFCEHRELGGQAWRVFTE